MKNLLVPIGSSGNAINTLQYAIDFACAVGSLVASKKGANSKIHPEEIIRLQEA